ncbi:type II secretion system F family protein [Alicyclobacillus sp. SO9]|uniref:type II secretion system F family protein n=1 Tax=Alicyclobacillus sp. SO9 TaxID=2665646 RepID=UPI0018E88F45|nr:type II secretion system F family protein [Alicyclobacillus sp. SO9]QQE79455.1 type II secretion system F family protein [Alicyclobacillus sp. SO9]
MNLMTTVLLTATVTVWVYLLLLRLTGRHRKMNQRIRYVTELPKAESSKKKSSEAEDKKTRVMAVSTRLSAVLLKGRSQEKLSGVQTKLTQAGNPFDMTVAEWIGIRALIALAGFGTGILVISFMHHRMMSLLLLIALPLLCWLVPDLWLSRKVDTRKREILRLFPSSLDLLTVSVEAGLGFDQAIGRVAAKTSGPLALELDRVIREMQLGSQRSAALQRLAERTGVDAVGSFVSAVIQAERLGIGIAQVLRVQSAEVRRKRKLDAEERAMKAPIKMLFPLVLFVFPALFIVILGPAFLNILTFFTHG